MQKHLDLSQLYGNEPLKTMLSQAIVGGHTAHAYLLEGAAGSGKTTLSFLLAAALCCENDGARPCRCCASCRKILRAQSPDLTVLGVDRLPFVPDGENTVDAAAAPKTKSIGVDAVRALKSDIYIKPNDLDYKLYIIGHTERMTVQAQNALLKLLEEPPEGAVFFLLCENRAALLPTVLSRVQRLTMEKFTDAALYELLLAHDRDAKQLAARDDDRLRLFVRLADGAWGRARAYLLAEPKALAADGMYEAHEAARQCLETLFSDAMTDDSPVLGGAGAQNRRPTRTALLAQIAGRADASAEARERMRALLDALCAALRDLLMCAQGVRGQLLFYPTETQPEALSARCSSQTLMETYRALAAIRAEIDANPNVGMLQISVVNALFALRA